MPAGEHLLQTGQAMASAGESNGWRAEIGTDRKEIGDFACLLHAVIGIRAR
jgi:hypothetical protein